MVSSPIQQVVVVGASSAGLIAALTFKHFFPQLQVTLVYSPKQAPIGVGESTTAWLPQFLHDHLKLDRGEFYRAVSPIWKLGIRFEWGQPGDSFFNYTFDRQFSYDHAQLKHPIGTYAMDDMAEASRFSVLMNKRHAPLWLDDQQKMRVVPDGFGYHLGIRELTQFLSQKARNWGVEIRALEILDIARDDSGNVTCLVGENGERLEADLFVDATGFPSKLLGQGLQEPFQSFGDRLFCDSAVVGSAPRGEAPIFPFTTATTMPSGWRWRIDLKDRISYGYVYASKFCSDDEARQDFLQSAPEATEELRKISFRSGRYQRFWVNNVIAVGNAAGFVEPLESTGQHMIAETLWRVVLDLQDSQLAPSRALKDTTNRYIAGLWDEIRDFLALHFKFNHKLETPFWQYCQEQTSLGQLQPLVDLYQDSGLCRALQTLVPTASIFETDGYLTLLRGQKLPVRQLPQLSESEQQAWQAYRAAIRQELHRSVTPEQGLEILAKSTYAPARHLRSPLCSPISSLSSP